MMWIWIAFTAFFLVMLALGLGVLHHVNRVLIAAALPYYLEKNSIEASWCPAPFTNRRRPGWLKRASRCSWVRMHEANRRRKILCTECMTIAWASARRR